MSYNETVLIYDWNEDKNAKLRIERNISFEQIVAAINSGGLLDQLPHPNQGRYRSQHLLIVKIDNYVYVVPCIINSKRIFFKTVYASRKFTKKYLLK